MPGVKQNAPRRRAKKRDASRSPVTKKEMEILSKVRDCLPANWSLHREGTGTRAFQVLDSYDLSLLCAGKALLEFPGDPAEIRLLPEKEECSVDVSIRRIDASADSLPSGHLKDAVVKCIGAWRLGKRAEGMERVERHRISNDDQKGVARLFIRTYECAGGSPTTALEVIPYRGYSDEAERVGRSIEDLYPTSSIPYAIYRSFPETVRISSTPAPPVDPNQEIRDASVQLLRFLLTRIRHYEPGVACNEDPEVLHRYRVTIRRMRSLVALLKTAFTDEERKALGTELKAAMQGTNRLRDLDVLVAEMHEVSSSLPEVLLAGMDSLVHGILEERRKESESVRKNLSADSFENRFSNTAAALLRRSEGRGSGTVADALSAAIVKRFRSIVRDTQALGEHGVPERLHRLRVSCKKLRYLIDLFPQLFDGDIASLWIRKLKALQDLLGRFNDLSVQQAYLLSQASRHNKDNRTLMAIGAVIMKSHRQGRRLAKRSLVAAHKFCSTEMHRLLEGLTRK